MDKSKVVESMHFLKGKLTIKSYMMSDLGQNYQFSIFDQKRDFWVKIFWTHTQKGSFW